MLAASAFSATSSRQSAGGLEGSSCHACVLDEWYTPLGVAANQLPSRRCQQRIHTFGKIGQRGKGAPAVGRAQQAAQFCGGKNDAICVKIGRNGQRLNSGINARHPLPAKARRGRTERPCSVPAKTRL